MLVGNKIRGSLFTLVALAATLPSALAQAAGPDYAATGPYLGIGVGFGFDNFDDGVLGFDHDPAYGFDFWVGYRVYRHVAVETQLEYLNGFKVDLQDLSVLKFQALTGIVNLKGYALTGRIQPFAVFGFGLGWGKVESNLVPVSEDELDIVVRLGGGLDYYLTEHIAIQTTAAYVFATGGLDGMDYVSLLLGAQYRF